jgi:Uma2 family endonuclease
MARREDMQTARAEPTRLTYDDYVSFPDDGRRHELLDGEHIVTPTPVSGHQRVSIRLATALHIFVQQHRLGEVLAAPFDVILSDHNVVEPDLLFVSNERRAIVQDWVRGAPDLVVEILSPSTRRLDEVTKRHLYDRFGVREYWIVDLDIDTVKVYRRAEDGRFLRVAELAAEADDALDTPLLPGFSLRLRELFAPID